MRDRIWDFMIPGPSTFEIVPDFERMTSALRASDLFIAKAAPHKVPTIFQINKESRQHGFELGYVRELGHYFGGRQIIVNFAKDTFLIRSPMAIACLYGGYLGDLCYHDLARLNEVHRLVQKLAVGCPIADEFIFRFHNLRKLTMISPIPENKPLIEDAFRYHDNLFCKIPFVPAIPGQNKVDDPPEHERFGYSTVPDVELFPTVQEFTREMNTLLELNDY